MTRKLVRFATWSSIALLALFWIAAYGVHDQDYTLDPLHFFERGSRFLCIHTGHDIALLVAVLFATTSIVFGLRKRRKAQTLSKLWYVISLVALLWFAAWLFLWFTVGVGFLCGGG